MAGEFVSIHHHLLVVIAGSVCLFGTWVGMRHFARARANEGATRYGWLFMASVGTGAALWASTFISILALDPTLNSAFEPLSIGLVLLIAIIACLVGFEIGSRPRPELAPELGGLIVGTGVLLMHIVAFQGWHFVGDIGWNLYGLVMTSILGLSLGALSVNRANRPVTRYCRHGAAIVLAVMICAMHYALTVSATPMPDAARLLQPSLIEARTLGVAVAVAVLLVMASGFSTYIIDLRTRTESADRIHQLSFNDGMTGLPNRIAFNERLAFDAAAAHELAHKVAVMSIDIDGFKDVNDLYGHAAGDLLLIAVADRMRSMLKPNEFLARQGGDEFLGLQSSGNQPDDAADFVARIAAIFAQPFEVRDRAVRLTASIGYSIFPLDTKERDQALSNAKLAMYRGKARRRGEICRYEKGMDDAARARRALARDLQLAIAQDQLELHYQLQTDLRTGEVCGAEALMRWRHPKRGMISPAEFIPLAEESGAIAEMGEWALRIACRDAASGAIPGTVAVNLSPLQLGNPDLAATIQRILRETGLPAHRLEVEVTESAVMSDQTLALQTLRGLKAIGVSTAIDDFGTGHSSLATLHAFPFDKIKLDQSFVKRLPDDAAAMAIVRTVIMLGQSLGRPVLAEGIETSAQWRMLREHGCPYGQGYLFARPAALRDLPVAVAAMTALVSTPQSRAAA